MEAEQFINGAAVELEMVEAQLRDLEARAAALRARADGLRFLVQYGREAQAGIPAQNAHRDASASRRHIAAVPGANPG